MDPVFFPVVERLVDLLVVEPPELAFTHAHLLVPGLEPRAVRGLEHQVVAVAQAAVLAAIGVRVDTASGGQTYDLRAGEQAAEIRGSLLEESTGARMPLRGCRLHAGRTIAARGA